MIQAFPIHSSKAQAPAQPVRVPRTWRVARMIWREYWAANSLNRIPETEAIEEPTSVSAFHGEGLASGSLVPIYHFNALRLSRMLPEHGTLLDLGSGSGRFLAYLARCRPDLRIIGVDLSREMVRLGQRELSAAGLAERVKLRVGDMTAFRSAAPERVDVVSSIFAMHHLQCLEDLARCAEELGRIREATGCGIWIFDHARPRLRSTAEEFPALFTPEAPPTFQASSRDSLLAAFSFEDLSACLNRGLSERPGSACSKFLRLYQAHQLARRAGEPAARSGSAVWKDPALTREAARKVRALQALFSGLPPPIPIGTAATA